MKSLKFVLSLALLIAVTCSALAQKGGNAGIPANSLYNNLIVYWNLDEASGSRAAAFQTESLTLTDNNTVGQATGRIGAAADFVAANSEFLSIADNASLSMGVTQMSICLWVNFTTAPGFGNDAIILSKWNGSDREYVLNSFGDNGAIGIAGTVRNSADTAQTETTNNANLSTGSYHFIHFFTDGTNVGVSVNNGAASTAAFTASVRNGTATFRLGSLGDGTLFYNGKVDVAGIWKNRTLTAAEVTYLYNGGSGRSPL